ncbi:beta-lactamase-like protein [Phyllosticta citrichinensis]|uniref:Beta-lactamase-like protein n=1 Tax=Phyllosticta citrichinensis TaxID=1130410 RepID=A0ABR1XSS9_9PEZI
MLQSSASSSFSARRLNRSTFVIAEDDRFGAHPLLYAKLHPLLPVLILSNTGSGVPRDSSVEVYKLRQFLEEYPIPDNGGQPLNPRTSNGLPERHYYVIINHCHYDRIGAVEQFPTPPSTSATSSGYSTVVASGNAPSFITGNLAEHSLCNLLRRPVPDYRPSKWAKDGEQLCHDGQKLDITAIHAPGHLPDEMAWYDHQERWLYVGDTFYERGEDDMAIVFAREGDLVDYMSTLRKLLSFVRLQNEYAIAEGLNEYDHEGYGAAKRVTASCGRSTSVADAESSLVAVIALFDKLFADKVPVTETIMYRGDEYYTWMEGGDDVKYSIVAPRRMVDEARKQFGDRAVLQSIMR